ncbi:hypothetical protein [Dyella silvae]|uniref:hypothetical protein n=1 Tax=Dyella silvae TaxID=2994424 RepID=UPI002264BB36|nr:hypothetical protein [Dyella silvae]
MGLGKFLIGCVLCVGSIGAASAMDADGQDLSTMQRGVDSSSSSHDGAGSGGDALGLSREGSNQANPASSSSSSDNCPNANQAPASRGRHAHLGWQSLLPGSIQ